MSKTFQKKVEDFTCEHCGREVVGTGYTNHCPACLWSKHVDINPGDRLHTCQGMMEPVRIEKEGSEFKIVHRCVRCAFEKRNHVQREDDFDLVVKIASKER
jgi:hypothetical protein